MKGVTKLMLIDFSIHVATSKHGNPQPEVVVENFTGHHRTLKALVLLIAAQVERASLSLKASWVVVPESDRVHLELGFGTQSEIQEALAVLNQVKYELKNRPPPE
jgi:hypothetical protein